MAWVKEASGTANNTTVCTITVPAGGYPSGHLLVMGVATSASSLPTMTVTGPRSNTWIADQSISTATSGSAHQLHCIVTYDLLAGDVITITASATVARFICILEEFDDNITAADVGATGNNGGVSGGTLTTGSTAVTSTANELIVGVMLLVSQGRVFTPGAGFTAGTKVVSTFGSGDRAGILQWRYVAAIGSQVSNGTVDSSTLYAATVQTYSIGAAPTRTGKAKVWDGSAWTAHPAKVWNGSAWVAHNMKAWDGTGWIKGK